MTTATAEDFQYLQGFLLDRSAIVLSEDKQYLVETRLLPVVQRHGVESITDLVRAIRRGDKTVETAVVDAMTTNETSWFRDSAPFDALRNLVLPELVASNVTRRRLAIWSAACSTGQELYSVAMLLDSEFSDLASWHVDLHGTDLSTTVVQRARAGSFTALEINRGLPATLLVRYFRREGAQFVIADSIRARVRFELFNLARPWPPMQDYDVILLRNVLIYFDVETKRNVLERVRGRLRPGGFLLLGTAETTRGLVDGFRPIPVGATTVFRREES
ncbi:MAG TPA: protein-glutamate O-methyltransferase CheR [Acidimicrobiales bacterium]|nr:protein-glutamate O-methyltransferase CheR [Acidimicrobiales bacterium]